METRVPKRVGIEFFSGIGAWKYAIPGINFIPFEINEKCNIVYEENHGIKPKAKNLATIKSKDIPEAFIWCMSPPCQPFSSQKSSNLTNNADPRNDALKNIIRLIPVKVPQIIMLENVSNFKSSNLCDDLKETLKANDYTFDEIIICPTELGIPNSRKRYFLVASRIGMMSIPRPVSIKCKQILNYLVNPIPEECYITKPILDKYFQVTDIIKATDIKSNCFTKNYYRYVEGTGSLIQTNLLELDPQLFTKHKYELGLRRFSPMEISKIFGFPPEIKWSVPVVDQYKLLGNSINIHVVQFLYLKIKHLF